MDSGRHFYEVFARRARASPGSTALVSGERRVTLAELEALVHRVASALVARGLAPGFTAGLHLDRSVEWVVGALGVHAAGGVVLPLPPSYPARRRREIVDCVAPAIVVDHGSTPLDPSVGGPGISLERLIAEGSGEPPRASLDPDQAAFILASSGSTGLPKLIIRSHRSFFHRLGWTWARHPFGAGDIGCHKAHVTTTHGVYELFEPLLAGAPVLILTEAETRSLELFWDRIREHEVTRLLLVPSALQASLDMPGIEFPNLGVVVLMGEYLPPGLAERALERLPQRTALYSIYGSTEASSALVCDVRRSLRRGQELALGRPIADSVQALVLDAAGQPVAAGEEGRLYLAGPNLFSGYVSDPEGTRAVLVSPPGRDGVVYDTRDTVRITAEGDLHFVGRTDHTVKVRGFRVHLLEVESALLEHEGVKQAAVVVADDGPTPRLVGFYTPPTVTAADLFESLRASLPDYMVPSSLVGLDELPLTARSKVDRARLLRSLPTAAATGAAPAAGVGTATASPTEQILQDVWAAVLGHRGFSLDQSFFEVGGTSLTVFSMVHRLREALELSPARLREDVVWRFPTLRGLARHLDEDPDATHEAPRPDRLLLTLRAAKDDGLTPLFVVGSAGGTVGAYERLARILKTDRAIVGLQDPFLWGDRPASEPFEAWVERYVAAVRERQPEGPYRLMAFSSAGAFGLELAQRLRSARQEVAALVLVDPLAMDRDSTWRYGRWALQAIWMRGPVRRLVRSLGRLRRPLSSLRALLPDPDPAPLSDEEWEAVAEAARTDLDHLLALSTLMELNSGRPFSLSPADFAGVSPERYLEVFHARIQEVALEISLANLERMVSQYPLQIKAQHRYRLRPYDGRVLLFEPVTPHAGLVAEHLRPWIPDLRCQRLEVGPIPAGLEVAAGRFGALDRHYRSMRDDLFVGALARALESEFGAGGADRECDPDGSSPD